MAKLPEPAATGGMRSALAAGVTLTVVVATFVGSASALVDIGHRAGMAQPWVLPVCLDGVALVAVTAIDRRRGDLLAWATLIAATGVSTALQVAAAPAGLANQVPHAAPPLAALVGFELLLRATLPAPVAEVAQQAPAKRPAPKAVAAKAPRRVPPVATPAPPPTLVAVPTPATDDDELERMARAAAEEMRAAGRPVSSRGIATALRSAGRSVSSERAAELARVLRSEVGA